LLVFTVLIHFSLNDALGPLLYNLPKTLGVDELDQQLPCSNMPLMNDLGVVDVEKFGSDPDDDLDAPDLSQHGEQNSRAIEGAEAAASMMGQGLASLVKSQLKSKLPIDGFVSNIDFWSRWTSPDPSVKPNFFTKWLHPEIYADYTILRKLLTTELPENLYEEEYMRNAYFSPSMVRPTPTVWIPRDEGGVSRQEVEYTRRVNGCTDEGAWLNERGRVVVDLDAVKPILIERFR
jgi:hypothetical protein